MKFKDERGSIKSDIDGLGIATVEFSHPSHNALPAELLKILAATIAEMGKNEKAKVILLKSAGEDTFCAGASLDELFHIETEGGGTTFFSGFAYVINAIRLCKKIVVGQVQGKAIGGGVGLIAACDYCFATQDASIRLSELSLNIGPFVIAPAVQRKIGLSNFVSLTLNPQKWRSAAWAKENGLYHEVLDTFSEMESISYNFCTSLSSRNTETLKALKKTFWEDTDHWDKLLYEHASINGKLVLNSETKNFFKTLRK